MTTSNPESGSSGSRRYAFVVPRFGQGIAGGAETLAGSLAARLAARGDHVEVFTTCARDNRTWENEFPAGKTTESGIPVHRFPVDQRNLDIWIPLQLSICDGIQPSVEQQLDWLAHSVNSSALYSHIETHADSFDALFFAPYLFGTTFWGSLIRPAKSYLIPCLHDEHYAYVDVIYSMFRQVAGAIFNAAPEQDLARSLYGDIRGGEVGMGFEDPHASGWIRYPDYFPEKFPYILYLGRKETGKNVQVLIDHFMACKDGGKISDKLKLVIAGGGSFSDLHRPSALGRSDIIDLQHVSEDEKRSLLQNALFLCQPSTNESFSIVIMEAWLQKAAVVVHAACPVTRHHCVESGGGLYFADQNDFAAICQKMCESPELVESLGAAGRSYVLDKYSWAATLERFDRVMRDLGVLAERKLEINSHPESEAAFS